MECLATTRCQTLSHHTPSTHHHHPQPTHRRRRRRVPLRSPIWAKQGVLIVEHHERASPPTTPATSRRVSAFTAAPDCHVTAVDHHLRHVTAVDDPLRHITTVDNLQAPRHSRRHPLTPSHRRRQLPAATSLSTNDRPASKRLPLPSSRDVGAESNGWGARRIGTGAMRQGKGGMRMQSKRRGRGEAVRAPSFPVFRTRGQRGGVKTITPPRSSSIIPPEQRGGFLFRSVDDGAAGYSPAAPF